MYLAINQEIQQKVYDEIVDIDFDCERITELKYLEMYLKETLRLFSPLPMMMRETFEDCDFGTGKTLKKSTKIFIINFILHQRKDIWERLLENSTRKMSHLKSYDMNVYRELEVVSETTTQSSLL
jgi:cytochrome P450 family 4